MHVKILDLKKRVAGQALQSRYSKEVDFKVRASEDNRIVKGYLAVFGIPDSYGTVAVRGCFAKSIKERGPKSSAKNKIIFLAFHDPTEPIGRFTMLKEDDYGLYFEAEIDDTPGTPQRCLDQIRSGTLNQYSYGFDYVWDKMEYHEDSGLIMMNEVMLFEGTCLAILASNPETYTVRSSKEKIVLLEQINAEIEEVLHSVSIKKQLIIRQLVTRYNSLVKAKPLSKNALRKKSKPDGVVKIGGYKLNLKQLKK